MNKFLKKIIHRSYRQIFPTDHDRERKRWYSDGGEKLRFDYDLNKNSLVIDLGGYKGQWASDIYARYNCRVLVFEPVERFANNIKKRFEQNPKITVFSLALGANQRQEKISLNETSSSIYLDAKEKVSIQVEDVASFFAINKIVGVDLLKINIEGGEYELMPRLIETGIIQTINNIQIQFHNISHDSEKRMDEIFHALSKTHSPTYQYKFVWENWECHNT